MLDLEASLPFVWGRRVHTVFIGGGTPSLFAPASIERLVAAIRARLPLEPGCEITLEANPGTFERERFHAYADAGVTRLSIGVQSFDDAKLRALGRVHDAAQARAAVEEAKAAFATFNLDLMYALPGQTLAECAADVDAALSFAPPHLSLYHLTIEPNTFFAVHPPALPDDDLAAAMLDRIVASARAAPASSATRSRRSRAPAIARATTSTTGSSATTSASAPARTARSASRTGSRARCACAIRPRTWPAPRPARAVASEIEIARADLPFEFMLNALRLKEGFEIARFGERTGLPLSAIERPLAEAERRGLIERDLQARPADRRSASIS